MKSIRQADTCAPAFTLIELLIAIIIIAILSVALAVNLNRGALSASFDAQIKEIVYIIEQARSYSLNNYLIEDGGDSEPTEYYSLTITGTDLTLVAYGTTLSATLETVELDSRFEISESETIYYFPPRGEICIHSVDCDSDITEFEFELDDSTGAYNTTISINIYAGYPEVESL